MKLYAFYLERGIDKQFRKEEFIATERNGVYYLPGNPPKWLCRHWIYNFEIGRVISEVSDFVFLFKDDEYKAKNLFIDYIFDEVEKLHEGITKYIGKKEKVEHGTVSDTDTK